MNTQRAVIIMSALLFAGVLTVFQAPAATSIATVSAEIISPTNVASDAAAELLRRTSSGEFALRIPGGASDNGVGALDEITLSSIWLRGSTIVISTSDSTPRASLVLALASSGGGMNGILSSGQGINLSITHTEEDGTGKGKVYAIIAYN